VSLELRRIKLRRILERRVGVDVLVERGVLPGECFGVDKEGRVVGGIVSPGLVGRKRGLERERVKDGLRGWVEGKLVRRREEIEGVEMEREVRERGVRGLVGLYSNSVSVSVEKGYIGEGLGMRSQGGRWGRPRREKERWDRDSPPRAKVTGLRRFWEGVIRKGGS
jgi:hypothetical protein